MTKNCPHGFLITQLIYKNFCDCKICHYDMLNQWAKQFPERTKAKAKQYRQDNKEKLNSYQRKFKLSKFGLTPEDYDFLFELQEGKCAICNKHQSELERALALDHNHSKVGLDSVRFLLCNKCNLLIGYADENPEILQNAINYLNLHNKN